MMHLLRIYSIAGGPQKARDPLNPTGRTSPANIQCQNFSLQNGKTGPGSVA